MNDTIEKASKSKPSRRKYIIAAGIFLLIIAFVLFILAEQNKPDPESEAIIRGTILAPLNKDPNDLTDEDFAKITVNLIYEKELSDLKLFEKFINLQELRLLNIKYPESRIPKWMKFLGKVRIIDLEESCSLDLRPLQKIYTLKILDLRGSQISDITPLKRLINLEALYINGTLISDLEPVRKLINLKTLCIGDRISKLELYKTLRVLTNLQELYLVGTEVSDLEPLKGLTNLQLLVLNNTQVTDLEPLRELTNLQNLTIIDSSVANIEPLTGLKKLKELSLRRCNNITNEQIKDLQKALPNMEYNKYLWLE